MAKVPKLNMAGIIDHSTIDYPGKVAAVLYLCGCDFKCPFCHNSPLVKMEGCTTAMITSVAHRLRENFLIDAFVITGGEPLLQKSAVSLLKLVKTETKLLTKVDTNGSTPENLKKALPYLDFISMDLKGPLNERYAEIVGIPAHWPEIEPKINETLKLLKAWKTGITELRTTIVPELIDSREEFKEIVSVVADTGPDFFTIQQFRPERTLDPTFENRKRPPREYLLQLSEIAKKKLKDVKLRMITVENGFENIN